MERFINVYNLSINNMAASYNFQRTYSKIENELESGNVFLVTDQQWKGLDSRIFALRFGIGMHTMRTDAVLDEIADDNVMVRAVNDRRRNPSGDWFQYQKLFSIPENYLIDCSQVAVYAGMSLTGDMAIETVESFRHMTKGTTYSEVLKELTRLRASIGDEAFVQLSRFPYQELENLPDYHSCEQDLPPEVSAQIAHDKQAILNRQRRERNVAGVLSRRRGSSVPEFRSRHYVTSLRDIPEIGATISERRRMMAGDFEHFLRQIPDRPDTFAERSELWAKIRERNAKGIPRPRIYD